MSKEKLAQILHPPEPMGAMETLKETVQALTPGLTLKNILGDTWAELKRLGVQGEMEMANLLFNGSAFVPYGPGAYTQEPEKSADHSQPAIEGAKQPEPQQEQSRGGMEM